MSKMNRYSRLIEAVFTSHYSPGVSSFEFEREELEAQAASLGVRLPKNLGDIIYSFRFRTPFPESVLQAAPAGSEWVIISAGKGRYRFELRPECRIAPGAMLTRIKIPDGTPGIIAMYALNDEQALLARLRYNRLIDTFMRVTCYSLQNHLRTSVQDRGQVETDEVYVGTDRSGCQYVIPVQAKGDRDNLNIVQIEQDIAMCSEKFPNLVCRPVGAQFLDRNTIALFEFRQQGDAVSLWREKHYVLVPPEALSRDEVLEYRTHREED